MATHTTLTRPLGRTGIEVSAIGLGCWAIGGPAYRDGKPIGWGEVDDGESVAAVNAGIEAGVTFFDTANIYGTGHSERVLGRALKGRDDGVVIATKFGNIFDEATRTATSQDASPESVREQCEASLRRLDRDVVDLYQFHIGDYDPVAAEDVVAVLEELVAEGKIRSFGWSTDDPERAAVFARSEHCSAVQFAFNVLDGSSPVLDLCESRGLSGILRGPLARGALSGKFTPQTRFAADDVRHRVDYGGEQAPLLAAVESLRDVLGSRGRTVAQGALCWLLARSDVLIPIPGFRTVAQATENAAAMVHGPLSDEEMAQVAQTLGSLEQR